MDSSKILIIGGTGRIGGELTSLLAAAGISVRLLIRPGSSGRTIHDDHVTCVEGDLADKNSIEKSLEGIEKVFLLSRDQVNQADLENNLTSLARLQGVRKIVKSSAYAAGLQPPVGYGIPHALSEEYLMNSGLDWVILRPYMFMQNLLELSDLIRSRNLVALPLGQAKIGLIDARDVALVAKTVLTEQGFDNRVYDLSGPQALDMGECTAIMSEILGRKIRFRSPPYWVAGFLMRMQGVSGWDVTMRKQLFRMIREDGEARTTAAFQNITGRAPRSFEVFIRDYQQDFQ